MARRKDSDDSGEELLEEPAPQASSSVQASSSSRSRSSLLGAGALPYGALVVVQLAYCVWHILGKIALNGGTNPFVLALYRQLGACVCLYGLARGADFPARGGIARAAAALDARDRRRFAALGVLGFGNIFGFVVALSYVTAFNSALLHPLIPVIAAAAAAAAGVERPTARVFAGVGLAASGALVVVALGVGGGGGGEANVGATRGRVFFGNAVLFGQCCCMGLLLVLQKATLASSRLPPTTTTLFYNVIAAALACVATPLAVGADLEAYKFSGAAEILATVYGAVFGLCLIYAILGWATARTAPTVVAVSMTLQPPLNAALSVLFLGRTSFTAGEVAGGALISAGLVVVALAKRAAAKAAPGDAPPIPPHDPDDGHLALGGAVDLGEPLAAAADVV